METTSYCFVFFQKIAGRVDKFFWTGQLKLFQRLTIFFERIARAVRRADLNGSGPARGFGYMVSWAFLLQVYGIFWSKFGYKVFSFSWILDIWYMIQKYIIHFSVLLWFLCARCSTRQPPFPPPSSPPLTKFFFKKDCNLKLKALMGRGPGLTLPTPLRMPAETSWRLVT